MATRLIPSARVVVALLICSEAVVVAAPPANSRQHVTAKAISTPSSLPGPEIHLRERFLKYLIRHEDQSIQVEASLLQRANKLHSTLGNISTPRAQGITGGQILRQSTRLRISLSQLNSRIARENDYSKARLKRERVILRRLERVAPHSPKIHQFQVLISQQAQQIDSLFRPAATPVR
jgi:hypothetical protein